MAGASGRRSARDRDRCATRILSCSVGRTGRAGKAKPISEQIREQTRGRNAMAARKLTRKDLAEAAEKYKNWGRWGPEDEIGTLNHTSPADIVAAARLVRKGKVISLALTFDQHGPQGATSKTPSPARVNPTHTM